MNEAIQGPRGASMVELGGAKAWRQRILGDIVESYQWLDLQAREPMYPEAGPIPCMVLFSTTLRATGAAYVIPQTNAHLYASSSGNASAQLRGSVADAIETMGFDRNDRHAAFKVMTIILDGIPDLIRMPTEPPADLHATKVVQGIEVSAKVAGKTVLELVQ